MTISDHWQRFIFLHYQRVIISKIVQVIDDIAGVTICQASTLDKEVKTKHANKEAAKEVGALIAKRAIEKNIKTVVYDRGGYVYHGVIKELAEAAREAGLEF